MFENKINQKYLSQFLKNIRKNDLEELLAIKSFNFVDEVLNVSNNPENQTYFLTTEDNLPLAIGGACLQKRKRYKIARVWLLCTEDSKMYKKDLYGYILKKIEYFKTEYDVLFNFIYKSNFTSLKWLKKAGFRVLDLDIKEYKLFYFIKGDIKFDIRYFTG